MKKLTIFLILILLTNLACSFSLGNSDGGTDTGTNESGNSAPATDNSAEVSDLKSVKSAVVQIEAQGTFVDPQVGLVVNGAGRGSGFIIDPSGIIVTNNHVVTGAALVKVYYQGTEYNGKILGVSECSDLAVVKIEGGPFPYLDWYNGTVEPGLEVYLAGFPLGDPEYTLNKGIVSKAKADGQTQWASMDHVIEHSANGNPGNSGGPLITADGKVVGIHYASYKEANQFFAIDGSMAQPVVKTLQQGTDQDSLGINGTAIRSDDGSLSGIWVASVKSGSPADKAGIKPGDILYQVEKLVLATDGTMKDYCDVLKTHKPGDTLAISVIRYDTGELLEGQINGRELAVTGTFDTGSTGGSNNGGTTDTPASGDAPDFYTEQFDGDVSNYKYFEWHELVEGKDANPVYSPNADGGKMSFEINDQQKYVYVYYDPYNYDNVAISVEAANKGANSIMTSLICRYTDDGWYELNIQNDGLYSILAYSFADNNYFNIANGGSTAIKQGKSTNDYTFSCNGRDLSVIINGKLVKTVTENKYGFETGRVGFGVSSLDAVPVKVDVEYFDIAQP